MVPTKEYNVANLFSRQQMLDRREMTGTQEVAPLKMMTLHTLAASSLLEQQSRTIPLLPLVLAQRESLPSLRRLSKKKTTL